MGFLGGASGKEPACQCRRLEIGGFDPWVGKIPWRRKGQPAPVFLPGKFHGQRSLAGYSPGGCKELDMTQCVRVHTHTHTHSIFIECSYQSSTHFIAFKEDIVEKTSSGE